MPVLLSEQAAFAKHLFIHGYPLWNPSPDLLPPERRIDSLEIGDVGIVDDQGRFDVLFNIRDTFPGYAGLPPDFPSIEANGARCIGGDLQPHLVVSSPETLWNIQERHILTATGASGMATQYSADLSNDGAHIVLPQGAQFFELGPRLQKLLENHVKNHGAGWLERFKEDLLSSGSNSLYILTGFYKASSWSIASFGMQRAENAAPVHVRCTLVEADGRTIQNSSSWAPTGRFEYKTGPPLRHQEYNNQTVFVHGITVTPNKERKAGLLSWLFHPTRFLTSRVGDSTKATARKTPRNNLLIQRVPQTLRVSHPSEIINQYLLTKEPSSKIAVTHDSQWITMLKSLEGGKSWTLDDLANRLETLVPMHFSIATHDGAVFLRGVEDGSPTHLGVDRLRTPSGLCITGPCIPSDELGATDPSSSCTTSCNHAESTPTAASHATKQSILDKFSCFRILVIGKSGVGKSTLIDAVFGIKQKIEHSVCLQHRVANIEDEITSPANPFFVYHDTCGFDAGDMDKHKIVKNFIRSKRSSLREDQLSAIWFCIDASRAKESLLEMSAEYFFKSKHETLGTIPIIVVFTQFDRVVNDVTMKLMELNQGKRGIDDITKQARSEAESTVKRCHGEINRLAGERIPYAIVSTRKHYEDTLSNLVQLTHRLVGTDEVPNARTTSIMMNPHPKIQESIVVGRQRYWRALRASSDFTGRDIMDCLSVIHADIVAVWNLYDPTCCLQSDEFKEPVIDMFRAMEARAVSNRVSALSGAFRPIVAGLAPALWICRIYQNAKIVQQRVIAFIVDLINIMRILFIQTRGGCERLTRRVIGFAYRTYQDSDVMAQAHARIQAYRNLRGRNAALDMIKSLINPERSGSSDLQSHQLCRTGYAV